MNILLLNSLPQEYKGIPLSPDFRNMIQADLILHDEDYPEDLRMFDVLDQLYPCIPDDIDTAIKGFSWFFRCGKETESGKASRKNSKGFDFDLHAGLIYSAFYSTYGISLSGVDFMHWWEFMTLFEGLPSDMLIKQIIYAHTVDASSLSKAEKKHVQKLQKLFPLKKSARQQGVAQSEGEARSRAMRRFEEVRKAAEKTNAKGG